jgi:hypothetical protein
MEAVDSKVLSHELLNRGLGSKYDTGYFGRPRFAVTERSVYNSSEKILKRTEHADDVVRAFGSNSDTIPIRSGLNL